MVGNNVCQGPLSSGDMSPEYQANLLRALTGNKPKVPEGPPLRAMVPQEILISDRCLQFGYDMGPVLAEAVDAKLEVGGFYLATAGDDTFALREFIVPKGLKVKGDIRIGGEHNVAGVEVAQMNEMLKTDYRMVADMHCHPFAHGRLRLSLDDVKALQKVVNKMAKATRRVYHSPLMLIEDYVRKEYGEDALVLRGDELRDAVRRFVYPDDKAFLALLAEFGLHPRKKKFKKANFLAQLLEMIEDQTEEPRGVNFAISFIFDNEGSFPYLMMGAQETFAVSGRSNYETFDDIPLKVFDEGVNVLTKDEVKELIMSRVNVPRYITERLRKPKGKRGKIVYVSGTSPQGNNVPFQGFLGEGGQWSSASGGPPTRSPVQKPTHAKQDFIEMSLDDRVEAFLLSVTAYIGNFKDQRVKFATWLSEVCFNLDNGIEDKQTKRIIEFDSLAELAFVSGGLYEDERDGIEEPDYFGFSFAKRNALDLISDGNGGVNPFDEITLDFMTTFVNGSIITQNKAIKTYAAQLEEMFEVAQPDGLLDEDGFQDSGDGDTTIDDEGPPIDP